MKPWRPETNSSSVAQQNRRGVVALRAFATELLHGFHKLGETAIVRGHEFREAPAAELLALAGVPPSGESVRCSSAEAMGFGQSSRFRRDVSLVSLAEVICQRRLLVNEILQEIGIALFLSRLHYDG